MEQHLIHVHWAKAILCNSLYGRSRRNPNSFSLDSIHHNFGVWYSLNLILNRFHVTLLASYIAVKWSPRSIYGISPRTLYSLGDIKYHKFLPIMTPESRLHYQISPCQDQMPLSTTTWHKCHDYLLQLGCPVCWNPTYAPLLQAPLECHLTTVPSCHSCIAGLYVPIETGEEKIDTF